MVSEKQALTNELMSSHSAHEEPFLSFVPWICKERCIPEPQSSEERQRLFETLNDMNSVRALGPIVKLMRWFSWFQCEKYYAGECWGNKLIMLLGRKNCSPENGCHYVRPEESLSIPSSGLTDKQELQQLKLKHGTWALAPLLVTPASMFQKDLIKTLVAPSWTHHAERAQKVLTPEQTACFTIAKCHSGWVDELYDLVQQGFLSTQALKELYPEQDTSKAARAHRLSIHFDFLVRLIAKRSMSVLAQYCRPPIMYSAILSDTQSVAEGTMSDMQADWAKILSLEEKYSKGIAVPGIEGLHFLKSSITRVAYILNERDQLDKTSNAKLLMKALIHNLGDTACVENTHQSAKDTLRESRHNQRSRVHKMKACMDAKILQSRETPHLSITELEMATATCKILPAFAPLTNPNSHKMSKEFQNLMQHKSGAHWWPSTSAATQFEEAMCFEYLMQGYKEGSFQLSCLAGDPGSVLVSEAEGLVLLVLAKSTSGFTAWILNVEPKVSVENPDVEEVFLKPVPLKNAMVLRHITSLNGWLEVPCVPWLENSNGALILKQVGEPVPLVTARVQQGLDLTVAQVKTVLAAYGVTLRGAPSKMECFTELIKMHAENDDQVQEFLLKSNAKIKEGDEQGDGGDSDFEDLLNLLEEDLENRDDPDLKNERKKLKRKRLQKPKVPEGHIVLEPKPKRKGKGKGRGRGKGRGQAKLELEDGAGQPGKGRGRGRGKGRGKIRKAEDSKEQEKDVPASASDGDGAKPSAIPSQQEIAESFSAEPFAAIDAAPSADEIAAAFLDGDSPADVADGGSPEFSQPAGSPSPEFHMDALFDSPATKKQSLPSTLSENLGPSNLAKLPADTLEAAGQVALSVAAENLESHPASSQADCQAVLDQNVEPSEIKSSLGDAASAEAVPNETLPASADSLADAQPEEFAESAPADSLADTQPAELVESQPDHVGSMVTLDEPGPDTLADTQPEAPADSQAEAPAGSKSLPASGSRRRGPNVYSSPSSLHTIAPPGCSILLNRHWVAFGSH